jgi:hypothetical protein
MTHAWRFSLLVFPLAAAALAYGGCSGDDSIHFTAADGDGGAEGGGTDATTDGAGDTGAPDSGAADSALPCPTYAGTDAYCKALVAYCGRCNPQLLPCDLDNFAKCEKVSATYGKEGRAALSECLGKIACARDAGPAVDKCVRDKLASAPAPTAAQDKVRTDVCTQCVGDDAGVAACEGEFFAKPDGGPGIGTFVLEWNDGVSTTMGSTCAAAGPADGGDAGTQLACAVKFGVCSSLVIAAALPKDSCKDGG